MHTRDNNRGVRSTITTGFVRSGPMKQTCTLLEGVVVREQLVLSND